MIADDTTGSVEINRGAQKEKSFFFSDMSVVSEESQRKHEQVLFQHQCLRVLHLTVQSRFAASGL